MFLVSPMHEDSMHLLTPESNTAPARPSQFCPTSNVKSSPVLIEFFVVVVLLGVLSGTGELFITKCSDTKHRAVLASSGNKQQANATRCQTPAFTVLWGV